MKGDRISVDGTVIDRVMHGTTRSRYFGTKNIGRCIFENPDITEFERDLGKYDALLCGSNWNAAVIAARTKRPVKVIFKGIDPRQVIEVFSVPNQMMPTLLREMDAAFQPSRAEACTNLPVKEAMACGLPVSHQSVWRTVMTLQ